MDDFKSFLKENNESLRIENSVNKHLYDIDSDILRSKKVRPMRRIKNNKRKHEGKIRIITKNRENDFMKYYFLVKTWASVKYNLKSDEIEFLMYFYSESYFSAKDFNIYSKAILRKGKSIGKFIELDLIELLPNQEKVVSDKYRLYRLTYKCKRAIASIYKKLVLEEPIDESPTNNPLFLNHSTSYKDKRVRALIKDMNDRRKSLIDGDLLNYLPDDIKKGGN